MNLQVEARHTEAKVLDLVPLHRSMSVLNFVQAKLGACNFSASILQARTGTPNSQLQVRNPGHRPANHTPDALNLQDFEGLRTNLNA